MLNRIRFYVDKVLEWLLVVIMGVSVINVLWQVFTRFVIRDPSTYTEELARFLLIWVALFGASYAVSKRLHLAIDYFTLKFTGKTKLFSGLFIDLCVFVFALFVMVVGGIRLVTLTLALEQVSAALQIKLGYMYLVLPLSGFLIMFYAGIQMSERIRQLRGKGAGPGEEAKIAEALD